jgi:hypothetical protein
MTRSYFGILIILIFIAPSLRAGIICPTSLTLSCFDDINNLNLTGSATSTGNTSSLVRYEDIKSLNRCNIGTINRLWYIDTNLDGIFQPGVEENCNQVINIQGNGSPIEISFPRDTSYNCKDAIGFEKPTWISGSCDVIGYNVTDSKFEVSGDACYKILRKFTVINWCEYNGSSFGTGVWTHTQIIKIEEKNPPVIADCSNKLIGLGSDCKTSITLHNAATDDNNCPSQLLSWIVEIDLWGDGTVDYKYGFTEQDEFRIDPVANGKEITITLPIRVGPGIHKVKWTVRDQCGNFSSCLSLIETKDTSPPTPYIIDFITAAFQADETGLRIPARIFDAGSYDNCTAQKDIKFSYSPDISDSVRVVDCTNAGFQFFTIHIFDKAGNYEKIDVFMLVFDNGSCFGGRSLNGSVTEANNSPLKDVNMILKRPNEQKITTISDNRGEFNWSNIAIFDDYMITCEYSKRMEGRVDIADLKLLQDYIFGLKKLEKFQWVAADADGDKKIKISDLSLIKKNIINPDQNSGNKWQFIYNSDSSFNSVSDLKKLRDEIGIKELSGQLRFKAIYPGDITDANNKISTVRSKLIIEERPHMSGFSYYTIAKVLISGIQISIELPKNVKNIEVQSDYFDLSPGNMSIDPVTNVLRFVVLQDMDVSDEFPLFTIVSSANEKLPGLIWKNESKVLLAEYRTQTIQLDYFHPTEKEIKFTPNPGSGFFRINDAEAQITDIIDITGKKIPFHQMSGSVEINGHSGIYFIKIISDGRSQIAKVIKI